MKRRLELFSLLLIGALCLPGLSRAQVEQQPAGPFGKQTNFFYQPRIYPTAAAPCTCIDLVFIIDDTGSMGGAINNVKLGLVDILNTANAASCGDLRVGLITFKDDVTVHSTLTNNVALVAGQINALVAAGGTNLPEASDEALREAVEIAGTTCTRTGRFSVGDWRSNCCKVVILVTDALPGGCDDAFTGGVDDINAHLRAVSANTLGIHIGALQVGAAAGVPAIMQDYALTTSGLYASVPPDGSGTAAAIQAVVTNCLETPVGFEHCCVSGGLGGCFTVPTGTCRTIPGGVVTPSCAALECPTASLRSTWGKVKGIYR
jgi:uncharacterized protein YegL